MIEVLKVSEVTQRFGGLTALSDINLHIEQGEIIGVIGPNGAGKTTLFNLITGIYTPTEGRIFLEGNDITGMKPHMIARAGFARTFQNLRLFKKLSVRDNVTVGMHSQLKSNVFDALLHSKRQKLEDTQVERRTEELLKLVGLWDVRYETSASLPYGSQRKLEIARALAADPKLLLLDEPAAGMNEQETMELAKMILKLKKMGRTILLIEHDMKFVMNICERIYVLNYGKMICEGTPQVVSKDETVIRAYLGEED